MDCLQSANWLVKSLDQRARTILKVDRRNCAPAGRFPDPRRAAYAATQSEDGGRPDPACTRSTISRVTSNKYVATPRQHLRNEVLLHVGHQCVRRRWQIPFVRSGAPSHPPAERPRKRQSDILSDDKLVEKLQVGRRRHRAAHGGQVPRGHAHPVIASAAAKSRNRSEVSAFCIRHFLRHIGAHILAPGSTSVR